LKKNKQIPQHIAVLIDELSCANKESIRKTADNIIQILEIIYPLEDIEMLTFCHKNQKDISNYLREYLKKEILSGKEKVCLLMDTDEAIQFGFERPKDEAPVSAESRALRLAQDKSSLERSREAKSRDKKKLICALTFNYSGREEITNSIKKILLQKKDPDSIDEEQLAQNFSIGYKKDIDLLICCAGNFCLRNFLLWQSAYAEIWLTPKTWLMFREKDLKQALSDFKKRNRRFGNV
jgi:undecaprenyl pyrophosphate synthase